MRHLTGPRPIPFVEQPHALHLSIKQRSTNDFVLMSSRGRIHQAKSRPRRLDIERLRHFALVRIIEISNCIIIFIPDAGFLLCFSPLLLQPLFLSSDLMCINFLYLHGSQEDDWLIWKLLKHALRRKTFAFFQYRPCEINLCKWSLNQNSEQSARNKSEHMWIKKSFCVIKKVQSHLPRLTFEVSAGKFKNLELIRFTPSASWVTSMRCCFPFLMRIRKLNWTLSWSFIKHHSSRYVTFPHSSHPEISITIS